MDMTGPPDCSSQTDRLNRPGAPSPGHGASLPPFSVSELSAAIQATYPTAATSLPALNTDTDAASAGSTSLIDSAGSGDHTDCAAARWGRVGSRRHHQRRHLLQRQLDGRPRCASSEHATPQTRRSRTGRPESPRCARRAWPASSPRSDSRALDSPPPPSRLPRFELASLRPSPWSHADPADHCCAVSRRTTRRRRRQR
jgi:hypothetical protein